MICEPDKQNGTMTALLNARKGVSLVELVVTLTILGILASGIMPLVRNTALRSKEIELRRNLRTIRVALDDYRKMFDRMPAGPLKTGSGYPKKLQELVDGRDFGDVKSGTVKFLRKKVVNPLAPNSSTDENWGWGLRSYKDKPESSTWGGEDVYDIYAPQEGTALDGSKFRDW